AEARRPRGGGPPPHTPRNRPGARGLGGSAAAQWAVGAGAGLSRPPRTSGRTPRGPALRAGPANLAWCPTSTNRRPLLLLLLTQAAARSRPAGPWARRGSRTRRPGPPLGVFSARACVRG